MQTNWGLTIKALLFPKARDNLVQVGHEFRTNITHFVRNTHEVKFHLVSKKCRPFCFLMAILKMTEFYFIVFIYMRCNKHMLKGLCFNHQVKNFLSIALH